MAQTPPPAANTDPARAQVTLPDPANPALPSLILIGDSTVRNGHDDGQGLGAAGQWGWGNPLAQYFDSAKINVVNRAVGGLSSRTYLTSGHWQRTLALVKPGDVVLMQFGHNDAGPLNDTSRARGTIRGNGDESEDIDNLITKQRETVHSYGWYLRKFIAEIQARGATAIVCSPIPRKRWDDNGKTIRANGDYGAWAKEAALQGHAGFIDLNELAARRYDELGRDAVMQLFPQVTPDEHTHTNMAGAELNAQLVVGGIKALGIQALTGALTAQPCTDWGTRGELLHQDAFADTAHWVAEHKPAPATKVSTRDGRLVMDMAGDATVWFRPQLEGDVSITYRRKVVVADGPNDRLSDMNQFWMATDPRNADLFTRDGTFASYDGLRLYYAGIGGNANTTTRLRRYDGGERALLADLNAPGDLLVPNREYAIAIDVYKGCTRLTVDGRELFRYRDPAPLTRGWFGLRTTHSRQEIADFAVYRLRQATSPSPRR